MTSRARTSFSAHSPVTTNWACTARSRSSSRCCWRSCSIRGLVSGLANPRRRATCIERVKGGETSAMQNSPLIPLAAFVVAIALASVTVVSLMAGVGGNPALNELQIGATAWALTLAVFGVQGIVSIVLEGRQLFVGTIEPRLNPLRASRYGVHPLRAARYGAG